MPLATLDWRTHELYNYLAVAGGAIIVLSLALYLLPIARLRLLACLLGVLGGLALGVGLGVLLMRAWGYQLEMPPYAYPGGPPPGLANPGRGGGQGMAAAQFSGAAPQTPPTTARGSKTQLVALVSKLDTLLDKPLTLELSTARRREAKEQLKGLAESDDLSDEDANARLAALQEILKDQKGTLEAVGYRWSGPSGGADGGGGVPAGFQTPQYNPFREEQNAKHLKAVTGRLDKGAKG